MALEVIPALEEIFPLFSNICHAPCKPRNKSARKNFKARCLYCQCLFMRSTSAMPIADTTKVMWMMTYHINLLSGTCVAFMKIFNK